MTTEQNLKKYNLNKIDNSNYISEKNKLYNERQILQEKIDSLKNEIYNINKKLEDNFDINMEIGVKVKHNFNENELKIGDKILFYSYQHGYGIFKGIYERNEGYASVKDIQVVYHPNNIDWCSHRVDFDCIIKIIKD